MSSTEGRAGHLTDELGLGRFAAESLGKLQRLASSISRAKCAKVRPKVDLSTAQGRAVLMLRQATRVYH